MNQLRTSVVKSRGELGRVPAIQAAQSRAFRAAHSAGEVTRTRFSLELVVIPTDSATAEQRENYAAYVHARTLRTRSPQGPAKLLLALNLLGTSEDIDEKLYADAAFREVVFALPVTFGEGLRADPHQHDVESRPLLGWQPSS